MYRGIIVCLAFLINFTALAASARTSLPSDYTILGRELLFDGSLSGIRGAYQVFENGLNDSSCTECQTDMEFTFFHCLADTAMLFVRDDSNSVDSVFELMQKFGVIISGEYWAPYFEPDGLDFNEVRNQHNVYEIPQDAPDINAFKNILDASFIPEIEEIISDLNSISDTPTDRFRIYLSADELSVFSPFDYDFEKPLEPVEVDYAEVLMLKGILTALKAQLEFKAAYDTYTDPNDKLFEKLYGGSLKINEDILLPRPEILKVLPTVNDSNDGAAIQAQAVQDWVSAINYYFDMVDYIRLEDDLQTDDFFYIDPNDEHLADTLENKLTILRDSLINDMVATFPLETTKTYDIYGVNSVHIGQLVLIYNATGFEGDSGSLTFTDGNLPSSWDIDWGGITDANRINVDLEYYSDGQWMQGWFEGDLSNDGNTIANATLEYWGDSSGTLNNLSGQIADIEVNDANIDLNPIFGSTARYANPINLRDLLPVFDQWNEPLPGTVGHGLGDDPTLGGILPQMTQYDWQKEFNLQPSGMIYLDFISSSQITIDGDISDWSTEQLILNDISGDAEEDSSGFDIKNLYLAYDWRDLYGAIETYDTIGSGEHYYSLSFNYSEDDISLVHVIRVGILVSNGNAYVRIRYMDDDGYGGYYWRTINQYLANCGQNAVEFKISFDDIPDYLPGRFISVNSYDCPTGVCYVDKNQTHLKLGEVGTISGTVAYDGFKGDPIFIQAYTDPEEPEETVIATTMITEPGSYTLEGIGLGWTGFVRAFTPLFGFDNPFEVSAFQIQTATPVFMMYDDLSDVDITLNYPIKLEKNIPVAGEIDSEIKEVDWYYFDAVAGGTYTIDLARDTAEYASIALYERNARWEMIGLDCWETQQIIWLCEVSGRYYIEVKNDYYQPAGGTYQIQMTSDITCPRTDVANTQWVGVKDCKVNFYDLAVLVSHWLDNCSSPYWCDEIDFNKSGSANFSDFAAIADEWMLSGM